AFALNVLSQRKNSPRRCSFDRWSTPTNKRMKPHWLIAVFCLAPVLSLFAAAEIVPLPEKISPAISDRQIPSAPDQVHLGGLLGERVLGNEANRLRNVDTAR